MSVRAGPKVTARPIKIGAAILLGVSSLDNQTVQIVDAVSPFCTETSDRDELMSKPDNFATGRFIGHGRQLTGLTFQNSRDAHTILDATCGKGWRRPVADARRWLGVPTDLF